jgi:uncharacterized membrane protein
MEEEKSKDELKEAEIEEAKEEQKLAQPAGTGLDPKLAALLSYVLGWITGLIFFLIEKDKYVRFHALQSIFFSIATFVVWLGYVIVAIIFSFIPIIGAIISLLLWLTIGIGCFVLWIMLMVKAYQGERYKLPLLGDWAEQNI